MSQTHHGLLVHIVFSTKWRYPLLQNEWRDDLYAYIGGTIREHNGILLISGGIEDHVHLLVKVHPSFAIADTVRHLKSNSSRWINEQREISCRFEWQRGYGVFSVSQSLAETVKRYIANQREHHQGKSFEMNILSCCAGTKFRLMKSMFLMRRLSPKLLDRCIANAFFQAIACRRFAAQNPPFANHLGLAPQAIPCRRFAAEELKTCRPGAYIQVFV